MSPHCISIVTPSYNQGRFIEQTIQSVISQDIGCAEYIIMDGASTDETPGVLGRYAAHPRVTRVICQKDRGQADALVKGFALCTSPILGWINSDDLLAPGALKEVVSTFAEHPEVDVVVGRVCSINSRGEDMGLLPRAEMSVRDWRRTTMSIQQPCTFFRAEAYRRVGGIDPGIHHVMDYDLFMRIALAGGVFHYLPDVLAHFRFHADSKTVGTPWKLWREEWIVFRRNGGRPFSAFYYWKSREILSCIIKRKLLKIRHF